MYLFLLYENFVIFDIDIFNKSDDDEEIFEKFEI